jgi:TetR/AcrR family transcriptional regulator
MNRARSHSATRRGSRRQPELSRRAILQAALVEFAQEGLAGARMDAIAEAAGVNKALLYYYFRDKETLYGAILDDFFSALVERIIHVCNQPGSAGERFLTYVGTHFDVIAASPYYARIFMSELMSAGRGASTRLEHIFARYMKPIGACLLGLMQQGIASGEFRSVDPNQFLPSTIGSIVHYFLTAPLRQKFMPELYLPRERAIQQRRAAVLDFVGAALFADRDAGVRLAAQIAAQPAQRGRGGRVASRKIGDRRDAALPSSPASRQASTPTSTPAPTPAPPPIQETNPAEPKLGARAYRWLDRWFPDYETACKVLQEEADRRRKRGRRKPPTTPGEERGPQ